MRTTTTSAPDPNSQLDTTTICLTVLGILMISALVLMRS